MMMPRRAFAASSIGTVSTRGVLLGRLQQTLVKNAPFAVLAFFVSAVVFGGWIYSKVGTEADNLGDATFKAYSLLNDIPGADACAEETLPAKLLAQMLHIVGVFTFAVVLGIVSDGISTKVESVRLSNDRVLESKHTVQRLQQRLTSLHDSTRHGMTRCFKCKSVGVGRASCWRAGVVGYR